MNKITKWLIMAVIIFFGKALVHAGPLHLLAGYNAAGQINSLLNLGMDIEDRDPFDGGTPLIVASKFDAKDAVMVLLSRGANVDATDKGGMTALMHAAWRGSMGIVRMLLYYGADIEAEDSGSGFRFLDYADRMKIETGMRKLKLDYGKDVEAPNSMVVKDAIEGSIENRVRITNPKDMKILLSHGMNEIRYNKDFDDYGFTLQRLIAVGETTNFLKNLLLIIYQYMGIPEKYKK